MGRLKRYKKIKACDPFSKRSKLLSDVDSIHDLPPDQLNHQPGKMKRKRALDWDKEEDREILLQKDAKQRLKEAQLEEIKKESSSSEIMNKKLERKRDDETMRDFMKRIRLETRKTLAEQTKKLSSTAQKRKQHLKEKKKLKKFKRFNKMNVTMNQEQGRDVDEWTEHTKKEIVRFGEVADRPPDLSVFKLKMEVVKEKRIQKLNKQHMPLTQASDIIVLNKSEELKPKERKRKLDEIIGDISTDEYGPSRSSYGKISSLNVEELDRLRTQAQLAYKAVKAKRISKYK